MADPSCPGGDRGQVTFRLDDDRAVRLTGVRLSQEVRIPGDQLDLGRDGRAWTKTFARPAVDRMEYLFELSYADGRRETICDPANPKRAGGAFGDHSVHEFAEYRAPQWLDRPTPAPGTYAELDIAAPGLTQAVTGRLWSPPGLDAATPAGLVVVHDGPEYDDLAAFTRYLNTSIHAGTIAPVRAALLAPGPREDWYSASAAYGRALTRVVLPHLRDAVAVTRVIGVGASLGALEMLVAHHSAPRAFDGLFLQSGSYFQRGLDDQEQGFPDFRRITRNVAGLVASPGSSQLVPTVLTCGGIEENLGNNRAILEALVSQGYPAVLHEIRDVHNYTAWRDALDPHLTALIQKVADG